MIKVFGYLKRKPGQSLQEFADYHEHNHVPLVLSKAPMPLVYKRNYIQRGDSFNIEGDEIRFDCMTELAFADRDDLLAWMTSLGDDEIARHEDNFIDRAATRAYVVDERTSAVSRRQTARCSVGWSSRRRSSKTGLSPRHPHYIGGKPPVATGPHRRGVTRIRHLPWSSMARR
jgi:uncharacterized protein (TIGR02118 family)